MMANIKIRYGETWHISGNMELLPRSQKCSCPFSLVGWLVTSVTPSITPTVLITSLNLVCGAPPPVPSAWQLLQLHVIYPRSPSLNMTELSLSRLSRIVAKLY